MSGIVGDGTVADGVDDDSSATEPVIDLAGVTFGYAATPVVDDISLRIDPG